MLRTTLQRSVRLLSSSPARAKTMTESVKEAGDKANKKAGQTLAAGIEKTQEATQAAKETLGYKASETKRSAESTKETASHKVNQAAAGGRAAKEDLKQELRK